MKLNSLPPTLGKKALIFIREFGQAGIFHRPVASGPDTELTPAAIDKGKRLAKWLNDIFTARFFSKKSSFSFLVGHYCFRFYFQNIFHPQFDAGLGHSFPSFFIGDDENKFHIFYYQSLPDGKKRTKAHIQGKAASNQQQQGFASIFHGCFPKTGTKRARLKTFYLHNQASSHLFRPLPSGPSQLC